MNKNQWSPSGGGGRGVVSKSMFGVNLISSAFGNAAGSQPSLRVKLDGRNGFGVSGARAGASSSTVREVINELPDRPTVGRKIIQSEKEGVSSTVRNAEV